MTTGTTSFAVPAGNLSDAIRTLEHLELTSDPPRIETITLLDTFDGRLQAAGLRLTLHDSGGDRVLCLAGDDTAEATLPVSGPPRFATDLVPGSFRSRLASVIDVRALLPVLELAATRTRYARRTKDDGPAVVVDVYDSVSIADQAGRALPTVIEVREIRGHPKPARRLCEALTALGIEPLRGDALALVAAAVGIDTTGFSASPTVPLDPEMPAVAGFGLVLANLAESIEANWDGTVRHIDPEFLHDLRVAVRRTRTVLGEGGKVLPAHVVSTARERFGWLGSLTGPARDLDVYLIEWERYTAPLGAAAAAALGPVRALLAERQAEAHAALDAALSSAEAVEWESTWRHLLVDLASTEPKGAHADRQLGRVVAKRIERAQRRLIAHGRAIGPETPAAQVHDLRKDAKKLRYLLECFGSILPERPCARFVKRLKALQENLGEHQDAEVHVALVREIIGLLPGRGAAPESPPGVAPPNPIVARLPGGRSVVQNLRTYPSASSETLIALGQLAERLDQIRIAARAEFADRFATYDRRKTQASLDSVLEGIRR